MNRTKSSYVVYAVTTPQNFVWIKCASTNFIIFSDRRKFQPCVQHCRVQQSHYRRGQVLRVQGGWVSQISRQSEHECGKVVSPKQRPPLPPQEIFLVIISLRGWVNPRAIVRPEELYQWNIPMAPSGIEPEKFRLAAQCLTNSATAWLYIHHASNLNSPRYLRHKLPKSFKLHSFSFSSTLIYIKVVNVCYMNAVSWVSFSVCIWTRVPCEVLARWTRFFFCLCFSWI
jgi:hypothetical protein